MHPERYQFLTLRIPPARMNAEETAWYLGFMPHDIPVLIRSKLLKPLGNPAPNGNKYFSELDLRELRADPAWLQKASSTIVRFWKTRNGPLQMEMKKS